METCYVDWSGRRGIVALFGETGLDYKIYASLDDLIDNLTAPTRIVLEATFESFVPTTRASVIKRCEVEDHRLLTVPTRETTKWRYRAGFGAKTKQSVQTDLEDAQAIREEAQAGCHLKVPCAIPDQAFIQRRERINNKLMTLRNTGTLTPRPRSAGYNFTSQKEVYAQKLTATLPSLSDQPHYVQIALGKDGEYNPVLVAAVGVVAEEAASVKEFDRLAGLHAHAYKSQVRADLMFWGWAGGGKRQKLNPETRKRDDITLSEYRRALRWLYRQLR